MTSAIDLERKAENAVAARLKQHPALAKVRMRRTSEDSAKVNQDIVLTAKRGEANPPQSGVYDMEITATLQMRYRKTVQTLPLFLSLCASMEEVFNTTGVDMVGGVPVQRLAAQLSLCAPDFHCYEIRVVDKDDSPQDGKHSCVWKFSAIAMPFSYAKAAQLQTLNQPT